MATVHSRKDSLKRHPDPATFSRPKGGRLWKKLLVLAVLLAGLAWAAPWIVANTPARNWVAAKLLDVDGSITIGSASLGWTSPVELSNVEVRDRAGVLVARIPRVAGDTSLASIAADSSHLGTFTIIDPEVHVVMTASSTNIEDVFLHGKSSASNSKSKPPAVAVQIRGGNVDITDTKSNDKWQLEAIEAKLASDPAAPAPLSGDASCTLKSSEGAGRLEFKLDMPRAAAAGDPGHLNVVVDKLPLGVVQPVVRRFVPSASMSGTCSADLKYQWHGEGQAATGKIEGQLTGQRVTFQAPMLGGDTIRLSQVVVPCHVTRQGDKLTIDELALNCDIGSLAVSGATRIGDLPAAGSLADAAREAYQVKGQLDLARLAQMLPSTLRIREGTQITGGRVALALESRDEADGHVWQGEINTDSLVATNAGRQLVWDRPIAVTFLARDTTQGTVVDQLTCDSRFLQVKASGTIDDLTSSATFDLDALAAELDKFVELGDLRIAGDGQASFAWKRLAADLFQTTTTADVRNLQLALSSVNIQEPTARLDLAGQWNSTARQLQTNRASFISEALTCKSEDLAVSLPQQGSPQVTGTVAFQGDVGRLQRWLSDPRTAVKWQLAGRMSGQARVNRQQDRTTAQLNARFADLAIYETAGAQAGNAAPAWHEQQLDVSAALESNATADNIRLDSFDVASNMLKLRTSGQIERLSRDMNIDLKGEATYDWDQLTPLLWPYLGKTTKFTGRETRRFSIRGPLASAADARLAGDPPAAAAISTQLAADGSIGWTTAELFGLNFGRGEIAGALKNGELKIDPIDWPVSDGRLKFAPAIRLSPAPMEMLISKGEVIQNVRLTPEICDSGLKFIAPAVAEATRTDGKLSLSLTGGRVPLADPKTCDLAGTLTVHSVQVAPGPLAREYVLLARQIEAILRKRVPPTSDPDEQITLLGLAEQDVQFRIVQGRVYHRNIEMTSGDVTIRTQGSVGMDETIDLVAEIPLNEKWFGNDPILAKLKGQTIKVPIAGTLSRPQLDRRALDQVAGQLLQNTARGMIEDEIGKQFDKLFKK